MGELRERTLAKAEDAKVSTPTNVETAKRVHIIDQPWTLNNWHKHINWLHFIILVIVPLIGLYGLITTPIQNKTLAWAVIYYFWTGVGITAGYHRLWAHRSYTASFPLRLWLAAVGGGAVEGSIRWWSRDHRAHHRYTDTDKDPYSVRKGLVYAHLGWMILSQDPKKIGRTDIADLNADPIVKYQHRYYAWVALGMGFVFPTLVAGLGWGDWRGGYFYAGVLRLIFVHHATFCVNSLAHWLGDQPFDDKHSPKDHIITAFATLGEGYHNFHHEFPMDFRNAIKWFQYDPTKWFILGCKYTGLASDLKQFPQNEIRKGMVQQAQKKIDQERKVLDWGAALTDLPVWEYGDFSDAAQKRDLILVAGIIHDVTNFQHPGGQALLRSGLGKDMTSSFNGGVYDHSNAAHNLLSTMRVAVLKGGMKVEIWKDKRSDPSYIEANQQYTRVSAPPAIAATA